ncbi:MAG: cation-translocating P-type ATPase [Verrucomicrobia bacterium]|nr:cation-translocating P-type ATPase [Verrucomicrobiota bacterium]
MVKPPCGILWHGRPADDVLAALDSTPNGLSSLEAARRLAVSGANQLKEALRVSPLRIFLGQFKNLIVWILIVVGIISGVLGEIVDGIAILAIVVLNAVIGFYQEYNAEKSIASLKKMTAPRAKVRRDGRVASIPATEIVEGDVLELDAGDLVAADARLLKASSLKCVESALTGESDAVTKRAVTLDKDGIALGDRENMVFMGTIVATGQGRAVVVATAMKTEIGRIAGLIEAAGSEEATPLQQKLEAFGRILVGVSVGVVAVLFVLGLLRGMEFFEMFMTSVSLAVAAVPEGLPAVVTVSLALGVQRMARRRALVRKLPSVETLGCTNVICTDKTGTLTVGEMTVRQLHVGGQTYEVTGEGYGPHGEVRLEGESSAPPRAAPLLELATVLIGSNNAHLVLEDGTWKVVGDPTEGALLSVGHKAGGSKERIDLELPKRHEIPFDSDRKRRTVVRQMPDGRLRAFINGAPDMLLPHCTKIYAEGGVRVMTEADRQHIIAQCTTMAEQALRVLGSAYRDVEELTPARLIPEVVERDLVFVGLAGLHDPPRPEAKEAVAKCRRAGIRVVMITGDHPHTAMAIARQLGIASDGDAVIAGPELDKITDEELCRRAATITVYARVTAEHKLRIIRAWQTNAAVVAMTGDGVNDAPAIKQADIGIAMGRSGAEVTKQASDMIIADDNFASIVAAVEEGRGIYDNIRKTLQYLLAGNTGELLLMTFCVVAGLPTPLLPIQLLWINLVTDGLPALCLAIDPIDPDVMKRRPRPRAERITEGGFLSAMFLTGVLTAAISFAVYLYGLENRNVEFARTHAFTTLVFAELLRSFGGRSESKPVWRVSLFSNLNLALVVAASFGLQLWSHHSTTFARFLKTSPVPATDCAVLLAVSALPLIWLELAKVIRLRSRRGLPQ